MKSVLRFLLFIFAVAVGVAAIYFWKRASDLEARMSEKQAGPPPVYTNTSLAALDTEVTQLVNTVLPSVVSIQALSNQGPTTLAPFGAGRPEGRETQVGSGVIVSKDGYIITNLHVVEGGNAIDVTLHDGRHYAATLAGSYAPADIAILKIDATDLQPIPIGDSQNVQVGQTVFAIGNPFGLQESVSHGIISGRDRRSPDESSINEFFQTNATLNPGNSGGPLVNTRGELIGINNFIFSPSGGWQGIGFVIPSNTARKIFDDIVNKGRVVLPYLGFESWKMITPDVQKRLQLPDRKGVLIANVQKSSPAESAGLKPGDVIREFNNRKISDFTDLRNRIVETAPGQKVPIEIIRNGDALTLNADIKERPDQASVVYLPVHPPGQRTALDGIIVDDLEALVNRRTAEAVNIPGVIISGFQNAAPAAEALRRNDIILQVGDTPITSLEEFRKVAKAIPPNTPQALLVQRNNLQGWVQIDPR